MSNIVYDIPYELDFLFGTSRETLHIKSPKPTAGRHVVGFLDLFSNACLEIQDEKYSELYLLDYVA